jgi:hypothetical protein
VPCPYGMIGRSGVGFGSSNKGFCSGEQRT